MIRIVLFAFLSMLTFGAAAQEQAQPAAAATLDDNMQLVANDLRTLGRVTEVSENLNDSRQVLLAIIDGDVRQLRGPRDDGTYQWAALQREEGGRVTDEKRIERVHSEAALQDITLTAPNAYRLVVTVPPKQGIFSGNNRVWVRNVIVESTGFDGKTSRQEIPVNAWVNPGDANGVAFADIGRSVKATAELGVESGDKRAVANVALLQAKLVDDPNSPYFPAVKRLTGIREFVAERSINRGQLKNAIDEALLSVPGELEKRVAAQEEAARVRAEMVASGMTTGSVHIGDATPDVIKELSEVSRMLTGTLQEQADARARLETLIQSLSPKPAAAPE